MKNIKNGDLPVTPVVNSNGRVQHFTDDNGFYLITAGITKREAFAISIMQGIVTSKDANFHSESAIAIQAISLADALLSELEKS